MHATTVAECLDLQPGQKIWFDAVPDAVLAGIDAEALQLQVELAPSAGLDVAVLGDGPDLADRLSSVVQLMQPAGAIWVIGDNGGADDAAHFTVTRRVPLDAGMTATRIVPAAH
ncbi:hypothetical protein [Sphingomonas baiyangensis]|uniref:Uncharacterized protein n=1 Tax=Sphingomonas baiyangensis TaxID=2572576 RepID=A0A4U1L2C4_9SPHN|nr:hypothetical protein [Sphingomonas baiyangensis]TKD50176.1 hypothetical protein FBR43_04955 [Sphingomonas baiyangensis]